MKKDKLIEKLEDYVHYLITYPHSSFKRDKFESEIALLKEQMKEEIKYSLNKDNIENQELSILEEMKKERGYSFRKRLEELYAKPFNGHPSREDDAKNKDAVFFLADQIDILHKIRIKSKTQ